MKKHIILLALICFRLVGYSQSSTYINGNFDINAGVPTTWYGDVTFGPDAVVYIEDGATAIFYGKNMVVDPAARFICLPGNGQTGTGVIIFKGNNPLYTGYPLQQTVNGGYTTSVNPSLPNIEIDNPDGLSLLGNTRITNTIKFTAGHLFLDNFNIVLDDDAIYTGYDVTKHIVTNGSGVIVKEDLATNDSFVFPVSVAGLDFTPVTIANQAVVRNINVQVKDYTIDVETSLANKGMDRTWQISSNIAGAANVTLQHNSADNVNGSGTNQSEFNNAFAYVSQQTSPGIWSTNCTGSNGGNPISITTGNNLILPGSVEAIAFFTKQTVNCVDLSVVKTVNNASPVVGSNLTFTITASNLGIADATGVKVKDLLPTGYDFVSASSTVGTYNASTGEWNIGNFVNNATATLTINVTVNSLGNYANTAVISGNEVDPYMANNTSTVTPIPGALQANLGVLKTVDNSTPIIGSNVVFALAVKNAGPNDATGVKVVDQLPDGYTFISSSETTGTYVNDTGVWTIGNLTSGATASMTITAQVNATGVYVNTATISGNEPDPVPGDNTSTVSIMPNASTVDLSILKSAAIANINIGQEFDYIIQVDNLGASLATGVIMTDILPAQLSYVSTATTHGNATYNNTNRTINWDIGNLANGATIDLVIRVKAQDTGSISNTAKVSSTETDINLTNNTSTYVMQVMGLQIPNVITPNGDGKNDTFNIPGLEAYLESSMVIYNRWGNEVWKNNGSVYKNEWDGNGLNGGTYYYVLKIKDNSGKWQVFTGWVTLFND